MSQEEEKGFEVIDKRRVNAEEPEAETEQPAEETAPPESGEETPKRQEAEPIQVAALVSFFITELSTLAWQRMGLVPDITGKIEKDIEQARLAIDCTAALVEKLSPMLSDTERRDLQILISNLRLNFVKQQG